MAGFKRLTKQISGNLIKYVKKADFIGDIWDPTAVSLFELHRQVDTPRLRKLNPAFEANLIMLNEEKEVFEPPKVTVEYSDGSKWEKLTAKFTCHELRHELFLQAAVIESQDENEGQDQFGD